MKAIKGGQPSTKSMVTKAVSANKNAVAKRSEGVKTGRFVSTKTKASQALTSIHEGQDMDPAITNVIGKGFSPSKPVATDVKVTGKPKKDQLLLSYADSDAQFAVTRLSVKRLEDVLGLGSETRVIHYALALLRDKLLPTSDEPAPSMTAAEIERLRASGVPDKDFKATESIFPGL